MVGSLFALSLAVLVPSRDSAVLCGSEYRYMLSTCLAHTHTHRLWANETEHGAGNPGAILVDWLGPAGQCLIGQLVLVMSPLARPRKAVIGRLIKTSAPLSRLPCAGLPRSWPIPAPRRSQAASPVRHPLPLLADPKSIWDLGHLGPFSFFRFFFSILCAFLDFFLF